MGTRGAKLSYRNGQPVMLVAGGCQLTKEDKRTIEDFGRGNFSAGVRRVAALIRCNRIEDTPDFILNITEDWGLKNKEHDA